MNKSINAIVFGVAIIIAAAFLGNAYVKKNKQINEISITGLAEMDFTSNLVVWDASFSSLESNMSEAYSSLEDKKEVIEDYLISEGVSADEIVFSSVDSYEETESVYSDDGDYMGTEFIGYSLSQSVSISSNDVEKIDAISRNITELLNQGVDLYSSSPRYYYTELSDLKIDMIAKATENARLRAETIAENSGSKLGTLISGKMGIFQITGLNSDEDYSWGGVYNTSSKIKTVSVTMKLTYAVK